MKAIAFLALAFALGAQAQVYKWVDEKGQTQYGNTPPVNADASKVSVPKDGGPATPAEKPKIEAKAQVPAGDSADRAARCKLEREQLRVLEADANVTFKNAKGETAPLDGEKREAAREEVRKLIKKYC